MDKLNYIFGFSLITVTLLIDSVVVNEVGKLGEYGKEVTFQCDLKKSQPPQIVWEDLVFNENDSPILIFSSENNPNFEIDSGHSNRANFKVNKDYSLIASNLQIESGPGKYTCKSTVDGETLEMSYYLNVHGTNVVNCSGIHDLKEGDNTKLECSSKYSGNQPRLDWLTDGKVVDSVDKFDVTIAKRILDVKRVSYKEDGRTYTCKLALEDVTRSCSITLNVQYLVRNVQFIPNMENLQTGQELICEASGNPAPKVTLKAVTQTGQIVEGQGSLKVQEDWVDQQVKVTCLAENAVDGSSETIEKQLTVKVSKAEPAASSAVDSTAVIVGIAIAILILIAIIIAIVFIRKRKSRGHGKGAKPLSTKEEIGNQRPNGQQTHV